MSPWPVPVSDSTLTDLAQQAVARKRKRQRERDPGQAACHDGEIGSRPVMPVLRMSIARESAFRERSDHSQQHIDQRPDEVTEARLDHAAVRDSKDVGNPIQCDQRGGRRKPQYDATIGQRRAYRFQLTANSHETQYEYA